MHLRIRPEVCVLLCGWGVLGSAADVRAQDRKWSVDAHVGMLSGSDAVTGVATLPPLGETFNTSPTNQGRRVSSWFFGDGSQQLNARNAVLSRRLIDPLDSVLGRSIGPSGGVAFGGRVGRQVTTRLQVEVAVDVAPSRFQFDDDLLDEVQRTGASFEGAFTDLFMFNQTATSSQLNVIEDSSHQLDTSVVATFDVAVRSRFVPFVSAGGGWSSTIGDGPSLTLSGNYIVQSNSPFPVPPLSETDTVTLRFEPKANRPFADFGGGVRFPFSSRSGLRVDLRARVQSEGMRTKVSADPVLTAPMPSSGQAAFIFSGLKPDLLFSTSNPYANSTLSGVALEDFETFSSSETRTHVTASVGWFWRF